MTPRVARLIGVALIAWARLVVAAPATQPASAPPTSAPLTSAPLASAPADPPPGVLRVACIGDSITYGHGIADREHNSYPAQLAKALGDACAVRNFGVNGTTALHDGDRPYVYAKALAYHADVAVIGLGTNDTKPQNWTHADAFVTDYEAIIADLRQANPAVKVFVCLPIECYLTGEGSIRDKVIAGEVIPKIKAIAKDAGAAVIDLRTPLAGRPELLPDGIHPNAAGAKLMADAVARAVRP